MHCTHIMCVRIRWANTWTISKCLILFIGAFDVVDKKIHIIFSGLSKSTVQLIHSKKELACDLIASWTVQVGDMDQCLHLWRYTGGFEKIDKAHNKLSQNKVTKLIFLAQCQFFSIYLLLIICLRSFQDYVELEKERGQLLRSRHLQYLLAFSYWPQISARDKSHIYEMRSYRLKPGTMIEWGNNWARGIQFRQNNNEAYAGFFSQIGRLYNVHHIWCKQLNCDISIILTII